MKKGSSGIYCRYLKRVCDILLVLVLMTPALLIILACYLSIKIETRGPAFFIQKRPGKKGTIFSLYKLRTMIVATERGGKGLTDMERMTKIGRVIRALSLDELPQLWNIFVGNMSFIGPRPLLIQYLPLYTPEQARRHDVLPGISGWAQVNGRNELTWEDKFRHDVWYVDNVSVGLDLRIVFLTIINVLNRSGINAGVNETMEPFKGSKEKIYAE